jgi:hypothetical protein
MDGGKKGKWMEKKRKMDGEKKKECPKILIKKIFENLEF